MDMSIKEKIGNRIKNERTAKGLTRKALAELTESLKVSRINNYERGERTPGPNEIKQLAEALEVSPAFLMCLSDDRQGKLKQAPGLGSLIPLLNYNQACKPELYIEEIKNESYSEKVTLIPISSLLYERIGKNAFALEIKDDSMSPELRVNDTVIADPDTPPSPGDFVIAKLEHNNEVIIRKYKQLSAAKIANEFELIALNQDWASIHVGAETHGVIIGTLVSLNRVLK
ncbi:LexA family protein [Legionella longbeachae]|uniref:LexA family protein n=1 Tax=Legionella longbeachae TaxID=450 RepID=UPI0001BEBC9D|nr:putative phage repressor [Legionella longbeachae D-4968]